MRFSACLAGGEKKEKLFLTYLSALPGERAGKSGEEQETSYGANAAEAIKAAENILVLGDLEPSTQRRARRLIEMYGAAKLYLPAAPSNEPAYHSFVPLLREVSAGDVTEVGDQETAEIAGLSLQMFVSGGKLLLFLGSRGRSPQKEECVMNVTTSDQALFSDPTVDPDNLGREMSCLLTQDFTCLRKHNRRDSAFFADGHFLAGSADLSGCLPKVKEALGKEWERIRFVWLPGGGERGSFDAGLFAVGPKGHHRYFIGDAGACAEIVREAAAQEQSSVVLTGPGTGLCVFGCYAKR